VIVDFHSHSNHSDGSLAPQALAELMTERGVVAFSISDHDTLSAYGAFEVPGAVKVVSGVEINTTYTGNEVHVLGYGMRLDDEHLSALLERNRTARLDRAHRMVQQLQRAGYGITFDQVVAQAEGARSLGRPHVAKALIFAGMAPDVQWTFRNLLRVGKPGFVPSHHVTPFEAIEAIAGAGGIPVLAHPGRLKDRALIGQLAERGLRGLEVFYPSHDAQDVADFRAAARRYGFLMTAGMDFHDIRYHTAGVGIDVDPGDITPFLELVAA
jgi:3',5'-nucleoside bisphosphate phosphatase